MIFVSLSLTLCWYGFFAFVVVIVNVVAAAAFVIVVGVVVHTLLFDPTSFNWLTALYNLSRSICCCYTPVCVCVSLVSFTFYFIHRFFTLFLTDIMCCARKV